MSPTLIRAVVLILALLVGTPAGAYRMIVEPTTPIDPMGLSPGDIVSWDIFLDTQGESGITLFSFSRTFDLTLLQYRPDLSDANEDFPLYAPSGGKGFPQTFLEPIADPPVLWPGVQPAIGAQVNVDFVESGLNETSGTATHEYLARLAFEVVGAGNALAGEFSFFGEGNIFYANGADMSESVEWVFVPEPASALLVGLGIAGLGIVRRRLS